MTIRVQGSGVHGSMLKIKKSEQVGSIYEKSSHPF
jgi:hypothetical protein